MNYSWKEKQKLQPTKQNPQDEMYFHRTTVGNPWEFRNQMHLTEKEKENEGKLRIKVGKKKQQPTKQNPWELRNQRQ